jgi:hypothetical protein
MQSNTPKQARKFEMSNSHWQAQEGKRPVEGERLVQNQLEKAPNEISKNILMKPDSMIYHWFVVLSNA